MPAFVLQVVGSWAGYHSGSAGLAHARLVADVAGSSAGAARRSPPIAPRSSDASRSSRSPGDRSDAKSNKNTGVGKSYGMGAHLIVSGVMRS